MRMRGLCYFSDQSVILARRSCRRKGWRVVEVLWQGSKMRRRGWQISRPLEEGGSGGRRPKAISYINLGAFGRKKWNCDEWPIMERTNLALAFLPQFQGTNSAELARQQQTRSTACLELQKHRAPASCL